MIKALVIAAEYVALSIRLTFTKNRAERFRIMGKFEKKLSK